MARENKKARLEKRFGKSDRLVDQLFDLPWDSLPALVLGPKIKEMSPEVVRQLDAASASHRLVHTTAISQAVVVRANNVAEYFFDRHELDWDFSDLPAISPPFPLMFVEMSRPASMPRYSVFDQWGCLIQTLPPKNLAADFNYDPKKLARDPYIAGLDPVADARWGIYAALIGRIKDKIVGPAAESAMFLADDGRLISSPVMALDRHSAVPYDEELTKTLVGMFRVMMHPCALTLAFMNCKNVVRAAVEPDRKLNATREKHGLRPFVRYNTINIDPMKTVLRAEGGVETSGLKKALHICRGHFARYTEEKPLFGKVAGTFWVPPHAKGTYKQGVVKSDYKVAAPNGG